jgi:predicted nucleic acid-binding protein
MAGQVCVDASLALMLLLPHDLTPQVDALWHGWVKRRIDRVTAPLFFAEVSSVLRERVYHSHIRIEEGDAAFAAFLRLNVHSVAPADLQPRAWSMAKKYNRPRTYDAQYLAVAASVGCDLWTGDQRLVNAVKAPWVRWVGAESPRAV